MAPETDIPTLLKRLAAELHALETAGRGIEDAVGDLIAADRGRLPLALQDLDRLVQRLRDLAAFSAELASLAPQARIQSQPLSATLRLGHSRAALLGETARPDAVEDDHFF